MTTILDALKERFAALLALFPPGTLVKVAVVSAIVFVGTLIVIPFILVRLREDYFDVRVPRAWMKGRNPILRAATRVVKNIAGILFLLAGVSMLVLPGQGLLTILIGISLLDFPGKRRLEARIIGQRRIFGAVNTLRARFGKPAFVLAPKP
nr:putative transmembrane protein (PGPGW) [uncultured bacterium]